MPRITFLAILAGLLVSSNQTTSLAQAPSDQTFFMRELGPGVWAAIANPEATSGSVANAGFVIGDAGVMVIDTAPNAGKQLLAEIRKRTTLPIRFVVNTHYHPDHVANNGVFVEAGAMVLAHRNVRSWIHTENLKFFGPSVTPQQKAEVEAVPPPNAVYDDGVDIYLGKREVRVRSFQGHTGGDSIVIVPDARVGFLGDLYWHRSTPNTIDATTKAWIGTLTTIAKGNAGYSFVPGHGEVGTAEDVIAFGEYLATVNRLVSEARTQGRTSKALVETVMPSLTPNYGEWGYFKMMGVQNILDAEAELAGTKKVPQSIK